MTLSDRHDLSGLTALVRGRALLRRIVREVGVGQVFLVGGVVRDRLAGLGHGSDVDLAVRRGAIPLARKLAAATGATLVVLSEKDRTVRLIGSGSVLDLTEFRRESLEDDLRARDFTINAMALDIGLVAQSRIRLIDPCNGREDLEKGILRATGRESLARDRARIIRAYRLGAELGLTLTRTTRSWIKDLGKGLKGIAAERINAELTRLLLTPDSASWLKLMREDGVLGVLFPEVTGLEGLAQNRFHHLDGLDHTLESVAQAEKLLAQGRPAWLRELKTRENRVLLVKLALLFHDTGKKETAGLKPDGGFSFTGHEKVSHSLWLGAARRLRFSGKIASAVGGLIQAHMRPLSLLSAPSITPRAARRLVLAAGDNLPELGLLCLADSLATQGPEKDPGAEDRLLSLWDYLLEIKGVMDRQAQAPLIRGDELIKELGLRPGPLIGRLLSGIDEARLSNRVRDREEALAWCREELAP